jgi:hypothetical protein
MTCGIKVLGGAHDLEALFSLLAIRWRWDSLKLLVPRALTKLLYRHLGTSRLGPTLHRLFPNPFECPRYSILFCQIIRARVFRSYDSSYDLEMIQQ